MKRLIFLCCSILLVSCNYFEKQKVNSEDLLEEELQTINWTEVDAYPSFSSCDSVSEKEARRECFQSTLINHVNGYLSQQNLVVSEDIEDTITMKLSIDKSGQLSVISIQSKPETQTEIPEIDSLLTESLVSLPKIYPAIKRGQQVDTEFTLPIVVSIK
ncbi:hypothetical protein [Winogradskyella sp. A3E31]|uniref:hypothetical protein n=1 Tax=Winogradskyella sp. A3E31 TaxID=3349637 RepID=UPI00398A96A4